MTFKAGEKIKLKADYTSRVTGKTYRAGSTALIQNVRATGDLDVTMDTDGYRLAGMSASRFEAVASANSASTPAAAPAAAFRRLDYSPFYHAGRTTTNDILAEALRAEREAKTEEDQS